jgi:hypothetical protein
MRRFLLVLFLAFPFGASVVPQSRSGSVLTGRVTDASSAEPLSSVTVMLVDRSAGTATDVRGRYVLPVAAGPCTLRVSLVGYTERRIPVLVGAEDTVRIDIRLTPASMEGEEVSVVGERAPISPMPALNAVTVTLSRATSISGAFRDVYRTIQTLPGVASNNEMSSRFSVRGGAADQNLVLLNNASLLEPFHLKESPNTSASVIPLEVIGRLIFIPGGFPARYGDRLSSVLDLELRDGNPERFAGQADLSLINAGLVVEGPLGSGTTGILSGRTTYSDYIARYLPDGDRRRPQYFDLLGGVGMELSPGHRLSGRVLYAHDRTSGIASGQYSTSVVSLQSSHALRNQDTLRTWFSLYRQKDDLTRPQGSFIEDERNATTTASTILVGELKIRYERYIADRYRLIVGADAGHSDYDVTRTDRLALPATDSSVTGRLERTVTRPALFVENHLDLGRLFVNAGIRVDHTTSSGETRPGPRLLASWRFPGGTRLKGAWGIYYQSPNQTQLLAAEQAGYPAPQMQRAIHYTLGVEQALRRDLSFRVEAYIKNLDRVISFERLRNGEFISASRNDARGSIKGVEFEAAFSDPRVFGWINVAVMRAEELNEYDGKGWRLSPADQRKTLTTVFEFRIAERWSVNLRAFYGSGFAYLNDVPGTPDLRMHYPEYKRADARINHFFAIAGASSNVYLEILNIFAHRNAFSFTGTQTTPLTPDVNLLLPMILNIGMKVEW